MAYAVLGRMSLLLAIPPGYAIAVYPPAGIALGMLVARGIRLIPGIVIGAFVVNLAIAYENTGAIHTSNVIAALLIAIGAAIQAGIGSSLIHHFLENDVSLDVDHRVLKFFFLGGIVACCISPTMGVFSLYSLQLIPASAIFHNWLTWWVGDTLGVFTITPIVMVLFGRPRNIWFSRRWNVMLPLLCCLVIVIATFLFVRHREEQKQQLEFRLEAERISQNLQVTLNNHLDAVKNIERLFAASSDVTRADFQILLRTRLRVTQRSPHSCGLPMCHKHTGVNLKHKCKPKAFRIFVLLKTPSTTHCYRHPYAKIIFRLVIYFPLVPTAPLLATTWVQVWSDVSRLKMRAIAVKSRSPILWFCSTTKVIVAQFYCMPRCIVEANR